MNRFDSASKRWFSWLFFAFCLSFSAGVVYSHHSFSNPELMQVRHTKLDLTINFDQKIWSGTATLNVERLQGTKLILDTQMLTIKSVTGDVISWKLATPDQVIPKIAKDLGDPLIIQTLDKKDLVIIIEYETSPDAPGIVWMQGNQTKSGEAFVFAMNEPTGARSEFPCQDTPRVRGTYSANLNIIAKNRKSNEPLLALASNMENNYRKPNAEMKYENLNSTVPIPSYLFVIAAGRFLYAEQDNTIGYYADNQKTLDDALKGFKHVPQYFAELKKIFGDNPWQQQEFLFLPAMFGFGGMENPRLIYINEGLVEETGASSYVMAHELAHMWTGNVVTNEKWNGFWINEGPTTYAEGRVLAAVHGKSFGDGNLFEAYQELIAADKERLENPQASSQPTRLHKYKTKLVSPEDLMDFSVYSKGATMLRNIEKLIGREKIDEFLRMYINAFKFKPITSKLFVEYSVKNLSLIKSDIDWNSYLRAWIFEPGIHPKFDGPLGKISIAKCIGCDEKLSEFKSAGLETDFTTWNRFQILYLLKSLQDQIKNSKEETQNSIKELQDSKTFLKVVTPIVDILSQWYQLLVRSDLWVHKQDDIRQYLSDFGRGRLIKPLYLALKESEDLKALSFAQKTYLENKSRYFNPVSKSIGELFISEAK